MTIIQIGCGLGVRISISNIKDAHALMLINERCRKIFEGAGYARGYIQTWLYRGIGYNADAIPEKSAQKIFRAADQILRAGRPTKEISAEHAN